MNRTRYSHRISKSMTPSAWTASILLWILQSCKARWTIDKTIANFWAKVVLQLGLAVFQQMFTKDNSPTMNMVREQAARCTSRRFQTQSKKLAWKMNNPKETQNSHLCTALTRTGRCLVHPSSRWLIWWRQGQGNKQYRSRKSCKIFLTWTSQYHTWVMMMKETMLEGTNETWNRRRSTFILEIGLRSSRTRRGRKRNSQRMAKFLNPQRIWAPSSTRRRIWHICLRQRTRSYQMRMSSNSWEVGAIPVTLPLRMPAFWATTGKPIIKLVKTPARTPLAVPYSAQTATTPWKESNKPRTAKYS